MKKLLAFSLLLVGVCFGAVNVNAAAYVGDTDNIKIDEESNKEAIRLLTESGEINEVDIPLDKLTVEKPASNIDDFKMLRASLKGYYFSEITVKFGVRQLRAPELVPVAFDWKDNGIPTICAYDRSGGQKSGVFQFFTNTVTDSGVGGYNYGYYWRKFNTSQGSFWASAWDLNHLFYG